MTVGAGISVAYGNLMVLGKKVLNHVHENNVVSPPSSLSSSTGSVLNGAFLGVSSDRKGSRRVFPIKEERSNNNTNLAISII
ncbi:putative galactinol--sucrose galactosyltransferase 1 [Senna tora]|uniref:Putative galactinol--sucrose galactosyltransferase 1 n=1 Tax=Senna tora TaxID=362788 RepID=A0A834W2U1_9FABA|nr:putative galactinol--sucrose galactosyltransferase 1 [Senna tora]